MFNILISIPQHPTFSFGSNGALSGFIDFVLLNEIF